MVTKPETSAQTSACCHDGITIGRMGRRPMLSTGGSPSSRTPIRLSCFRWRFNERKQAHEECMRLLFKLDEVKEVSEAVRAERKTLAKEIQTTQDGLGVDA